MGLGRVTLVLTCLLVAGLAAAFAIIQWDQANKLATSISALGAVAAVGVAVWAAVRQPATSIRVSNTGNAVAGSKGKAVSGLDSPAKLTGEVIVEGTGDADASDGGQATSGSKFS